MSISSRSVFLIVLSMILLTLTPVVVAQSVQPAIVEYNGKGEGKFAVTNNTSTPMTVVLEPKSFSIGSDGHGSFRALDPGIEVKLSTTSIRLQPLQTYSIFYSAKAETYPSWFTIYATFVPAHKNEALNVRFQLPHTVYLYQKAALIEGDLQIATATYSPSKHLLQCDLANVSKSLGRARDMQVAPLHGTPLVLAGFPLLPGSQRHLEIVWNESTPPANLVINFPHFTLRPNIVVDTDGSGGGSSADRPVSGTALSREH